MAQLCSQTTWCSLQRHPLHLQQGATFLRANVKPCIYQPQAEQASIKLYHKPSPMSNLAHKAGYYALKNCLWLSLTASLANWLGLNSHFTDEKTDAGRQGKALLQSCAASEHQVRSSRSAVSHTLLFDDVAKRFRAEHRGIVLLMPQEAECVQGDRNPLHNG